jgi:hypothetical protein
MAKRNNVVFAILPAGITRNGNAYTSVGFNLDNGLDGIFNETAVIAYDPVTGSKATGAKYRLEAAVKMAALHEEGQQAFDKLGVGREEKLTILVVGTGYDYLPSIGGFANTVTPDLPTMTEVALADLESIDAKRFATITTTDGQAWNTLTQYVELVKWIDQNKPDYVYIPLNRYYSERARAFWDHFSDILPDGHTDLVEAWQRCNKNTKIMFTDADRIIWETRGVELSAAYETPVYQQMLVVEKQGYEDIIARKYRGRLD